MEYLIFTIIIIFIILYYNIIYKRKYEKAIQKAEKEYIENHKQKLESIARRDMQQLLQTRDEVEADLKQKIEYLHGVQDTYAKLNQQIEEQRQNLEVYEANQKALANERVSAYESDKRAVINAQIEIESEEKKKSALAAHSQLMDSLRTQAAQMNEQIATLSREIEEYSAKQAAINEAIMRQRAIDEQQDFYRVCLAPETASDVSVLNTARQNLKKPEIVDKIIYDNYIAKPVLEMVKRVLQNTTCSGIYKITCLKTGEIYIGKSTDIKSRWQQHCKSAFNCGTIAHSLLHTKMKQHGIEQFTFEVVEQVPKDQLSEREKFYINFYQTKETGLNERNG